MADYTAGGCPTQEAWGYTLTVASDQCIIPHVMGAREEGGLDATAIDAVLFDLDGTLMDTDDQMVEGLAVWLRPMGWSSLHGAARWLVMAAEGPTNRLLTLLDILGLDGLLLDLQGWVRRVRGVPTPDYRLMEGADAVLAELKPRYRLGVVTTRGQEDTEAFLDQHGLRDMFDVVVTRETSWRLKPHPEPIREAAHRLGVRPERCVMVGDTTVDVKGARRAGAKAVAVLCGFGERDELEEAGADVVLEGISDLMSVL